MNRLADIAGCHKTGQLMDEVDDGDDGDDGKVKEPRFLTSGCLLSQHLSRNSTEQA